MRKIYLFTALFLALGSWVSAQTFSVTLQVDMQNVGTVADTVSVAGNFQAAAGFASDWTPGITILTDANMDLIYEGTFQLPAGSYEYKFVNGTAWGQDEGVPGACAVNGNRGMTISAATTVPVVCFGSCTVCPTNVDTVNVTFRVDMTNENPGVGDTVSIAGDFQSEAGFSDWTPGVTILTDPDNDKIYTGTFYLPEGTYSYKYINGTAWGQDESVPSACAVNNNRELVVVGPNDMVLDKVCFATCDTVCTPPLPAINVTFRVNMSNEIVSANGLFVAGSFQDPAWVKNVLQMTDGNGDGVYEYTESIVPNEYQYKYYNGSNGDPDGETADFEALGCGASNGIGGYNRVLDITGRLTDTILPIYDYNGCTSSVSVEDELDNPAYFDVFPNPFSSTARVEFANGTRQPFTLTLSTITGQVVRTEGNIRNEYATIHKNGLTPGLYFVTLQSANGARFSKKVVIE
ncbi:MAG: T9SS type A sorting domain-containing protein [Bacteroidia bacterium]|nr:T9SS type A sorting domain-containing protein [Bacteroidia bacterium]